MWIYVYDRKSNQRGPKRRACVALDPPCSLKVAGARLSGQTREGRRTRKDDMHIGKSAKTVKRENKITDVHLVAPVLALLAPRLINFRPHLWGAAMRERHSCQDRL